MNHWQRKRQLIARLTALQEVQAAEEAARRRHLTDRLAVLQVEAAMQVVDRGEPIERWSDADVRAYMVGRQHVKAWDGLSVEELTVIINAPDSAMTKSILARIGVRTD